MKRTVERAQEGEAGETEGGGGGVEEENCLD